MTKTPFRVDTRFPLLCVCLAVALAFPAAAFAEPDGGVREADRHFQRGVALYVEADYHGALVEFTRAYTLAPNGIVLFNIGETQYQLRDYAGALATFEHYLLEAAANDSHRALAESNLKELRTRVGRVRITTTPPGAEVTIDDRVIGQTPFEKPIVVGIGQLTVRATLPGRQPVVRSIDIAAEDDVLMTLELPPAPLAKVDSAPTGNLIDRPAASPSSPNARTWRIAGWVTTGLLAGGAVTAGVLALGKSNDLRAARANYPANPDTLKHLSDQTMSLSIIADALAAAGIVVGGITLYSTVSAHGGESSSAQVAVGYGSVRLDLRF